MNSNLFGKSYLPVIMAATWLAFVLAILLYASLSHGFNANGWTEVPGVGYYAIASDNPEVILLRTLPGVTLTIEKDRTWVRTRAVNKANPQATLTSSGKDVSALLFNVSAVQKVIIGHREMLVMKYPLDEWTPWLAEIERALAILKPTEKKAELPKGPQTPLPKKE